VVDVLVGGADDLVHDVGAVRHVIPPVSVMAASTGGGPAVGGEAVQVVLCHALLDERIEGIEVAAMTGEPQRIEPDLVLISGVPALVQLVPRAELGSFVFQIPLNSLNRRSASEPRWKASISGRNWNRLKNPGPA
jgi:hypothetical protein